MLVSSLDTNKRKTGIWRRGYGWMSMQFGPIRRGSKADRTGGLALPHLRYFAWPVNCKKDPKKCPNTWFTDIEWGKTKRESEGSPPELPALSNLDSKTYKALDTRTQGTAVVVGKERLTTSRNTKQEKNKTASLNNISGSKWSTKVFHSTCWQQLTQPSAIWRLYASHAIAFKDQVRKLPKSRG